MKECEGDGECGAEPDAECLSCILGLSELEMKTLGRFLDEHKDALRGAGLSSLTIKWIVDATAV